MNSGTCAECSGPIGIKKRSDALYCSHTCRGTAQQRSTRLRKGVSTGKRRGPYNVTRKNYEITFQIDRQNAATKQKKRVAQRKGKPTTREEARALGFKSGFERTLDAQLKTMKAKYQYEPIKLPYAIYSTYSPDFVLSNGVIIEAKGVLKVEDRRKMIAVKQQHPDLDIRFVFMSASSKIPGQKGTHAQWAEKYKFPWADGKVPEDWLT